MIKFKSIFVFILLVLPNVLWSFEELKKLPLGKITLAKDRSINFPTYLAYTSNEQTKGFSGVKLEDLQKSSLIDLGLLFYFDAPGERSFWMPDTYFNLHLYYLDKNFTILKIDENLPFHKGYEGNIPKGTIFTCQHVLEIPSISTLTSKLKVGDKIIWERPNNSRK